MKKALSKIFASITFISSLFSLFSCSLGTKGSVYEGEYTGKVIAYIEYIVYGNRTEVSRHDFETGEVYCGLYLAEGFVGDSCTVDISQSREIINALYNAGLLDLAEQYPVDEKPHGFPWEFVVGYSDGTRKGTQGGTIDSTVFRDAAEAYYDITGIDFFRSLS